MWCLNGDGEPQTGQEEPSHVVLTLAFPHSPDMAGGGPAFLFVSLFNFYCSIVGL